MAHPPRTADQKGKSTFSGDVYPQGKRQGTIVAYDPDSDSYTVACEGEPGNPRELKGRVFKDIPRRKTPGRETVLPADTPVIVDFGLRNQPYISGCLSTNASRGATNSTTGPEIDAGGGFFNENTETRAGAYFRTPGTPKNMMPGDQFLTTPDGNYVSAQRGQINKVFAGDRAQIIVSGLHSAVRVVCENYEHLSAIGETRIESLNGKNSMSFRGRVDQKSERKGNASVAFDIGEKGNLVALQINDTSGRMVSKIRFSPSGQVEILATENFDTITSKVRKEEVGQARVVRIMGTDTHYVKAGRTETIEGGWKVSVASSGLFTYGQDLGEVIQNNHVYSVAGNVSRTITGGPALTAEPTNIAVDEKILNGSVVKWFGFEKHMANPAAMAGCRQYVANGAFVFGEPTSKDMVLTPGAITKASAFCVNTGKTPGSIGLGGIPPAAAALLGGESVTAKNPAVKFTELSALLTALITALDTHTHPTAWGPSGPPVAGTVNGGIFNGAVGSQIAGIASTIVMLFS